MTDMTEAPIDPAKAELDATTGVYELLKPLGPEAQARVLDHVSGLLNASGAVHQQRQKREEADLSREEKAAPKFATFGELFGAADSSTHADKALVAAYWLQVCQGAVSFEGFSANKELRQLGHAVPNITAAINSLKEQRPALVIQLAKSGKAKQARKTYKVTVAGIQAVEAMVNG